MFHYSMALTDVPLSYSPQERKGHHAVVVFLGVHQDRTLASNGGPFSRQRVRASPPICGEEKSKQIFRPFSSFFSRKMGKLTFFSSFKVVELVCHPLHLLRNSNSHPARGEGEGRKRTQLEKGVNDGINGREIESKIADISSYI